MELHLNDILELKKFHKDNFNIEDTFSAASELKYSKQIKKFMHEVMQPRRKVEKMIKRIVPKEE